MPARRTSILARLLIALTGVAGLNATAAAQPDAFHVRVGFGTPVVLEDDCIIAHFEIDGDDHDVYQCESVRESLLDALECAGYYAWTEGYTIVVDMCEGEPCIRFRSNEYRLTIRRDYRCNEMRLYLRPRYRHHDTDILVEERVLRRDTFREPPAIIFDEPAPYRGRREVERNERPGNRDGRRFSGREDDRSTRYETENFGLGIEVGDDDVSFDLGAGFRAEEPARRRRP